MWDKMLELCMEKDNRIDSFILTLLALFARLYNYKVLQGALERDVNIDIYSTTKKISYQLLILQNHGITLCLEFYFA